MADRDFQSAVKKYTMSRKGVNLYKNIVELDKEECIESKNLIYRNGMVKRLGNEKFETDEVKSGNEIVGLHRFYQKDGTKFLLAVSGTDVDYHNGSTWVNIDATRTADKRTLIETWGTLDKVYFANGVDTPIKWDGTTKSDVAGTNHPSQAIQFLVYRDRLLAIDAANEGDVNWSNSFDDTDWESISDIGLRPDSRLFGMILHTASNENVGAETKVLLAGASDMHLMAGTDLDPASAGFDVRVDGLGIGVGCNAPRTMRWTPRGSMWLGVDRRVYLLPFKSNIPIPVSQKIESNLPGQEGIDSIPIGQITNACATYHNGYYKLAFAKSGKTVNDVQWWLDVDRLEQDSSSGGGWGPWYGPMTGMSISVFEVQSGGGDGGELMAGEGDSSVGSFVYEMNKKALFGDIGSAIATVWQTFYHDFGNPNVDKTVHDIEAELLDTTGTVNLEFHDIPGSVKSGDSFALSGSAIYWDDDFWGVNDYSNSVPARINVNIDPPVKSRRLSMIISQSVSNDTFELYSLSAKALQEDEVYA